MLDPSTQDAIQA